MSIYRRGDVYWVRFQVGGVEVRRSSRSTSFAEARKFERAIRAKVEADVKGYQEGKRPSRTFAQAVDLWLAHGAPESMIRRGTHACVQSRADLRTNACAPCGPSNAEFRSLVSVELVAAIESRRR